MLKKNFFFFQNKDIPPGDIAKTIPMILSSIIFPVVFFLHLFFYFFLPKFILENVLSSFLFLIGIWVLGIAFISAIVQKILLKRIFWNTIRRFFITGLFLIIFAIFWGQTSTINKISRIQPKVVK
jgi:hypothetical protein